MVTDVATECEGWRQETMATSRHYTLHFESPETLWLVIILITYNIEMVTFSYFISNISGCMSNTIHMVANHKTPRVVLFTAVWRVPYCPMPAGRVSPGLVIECNCTGARNKAQQNIRYRYCRGYCHTLCRVNHGSVWWLIASGSNDPQEVLYWPSSL